MAYRIEIKKASNGEYYSKIVAENNEIVMLGETWKNKSALVDFCEKLAENITSGNYRIEVRESEVTKKSHGVIIAGNNEIVMHGELWENENSLKEYLSGSFIENMNGAEVILNFKL